MIQERDLTLLNIEKTVNGTRTWYHPEGYFVKAGAPGKLDAVIEVLVSDIAEKVGVRHIQYKQERIKRGESDFIPVAISRDFRKTIPVAETLTLERYLMTENIDSSYYLNVLRFINKVAPYLTKRLEEMIYFDCLIDNRGRTLDKVTLIKTTLNETVLAPLHRHDCALFCSASSAELEKLLPDTIDYVNYIQKGLSKTGFFGESHRVAVELCDIRPSALFRLDITKEEWRTLVGRYEKELGGLRVAAITDLLIQRQDLLYAWDQRLKEKGQWGYA